MITLLSLTSKVFSRIILRRISAISNIIRQEQAGFRKWKSCFHHIFTLRQIIEQSAERNSTIYANFKDFEKAFDSLHRESLRKILRSYGIPQKMVNIIKRLYRDFECKVICNNQLTYSFSITRGQVRVHLITIPLFCYHGLA